MELIIVFAILITLGFFPIMYLITFEDWALVGYIITLILAYAYIFIISGGAY